MPDYALELPKVPVPLHKSYYSSSPFQTLLISESKETAAYYQSARTRCRSSSSFVHPHSLHIEHTGVFPSCNAGRTWSLYRVGWPLMQRIRTRGQSCYCSSAESLALALTHEKWAVGCLGLQTSYRPSRHYVIFFLLLQMALG